MVYTYCKQQLFFKKINLIKVFLVFLVITIFTSVVSYFVGISTGFKNMTEVEKLIVIKKTDEFSKEKMVQMLKDLNVRFPHIAMAQSIAETGHWKSGIFLENNNMFGMKEAKSRITTAAGTNRNHATYNHWRESIYDYAFYQCRYLGGIKVESEYYQYLNASYAEDPEYVKNIKNIVQREKLKDLFKK